MSKNKKQTKAKDRKTAKRKIRLKKQKNTEVKQSQKSSISVEEVVNHAMYLTEKKQFGDAEKILMKLYKTHPEHPHVLYGIGTIASFMEKWDKAVDFFDRAIAKDPYLLQARFNKAAVYKESRDPVNMVLALQDVIKNGDSRHPLVIDAQETLDSFTKHLEKYENLSLENYMKSSYLFLDGVKCMENNDPEKALKLFQNSFDYNPKAYQCAGNIGICHAAMGNKEKALAAFDRAIEMDPDYEPAIINRAIVKNLKKGEKLQVHGKSINYNSDYRIKNKSYLEKYLKQGQL